MKDLSRYDELSLIPLVGKKPARAWKEFQAERATQQQIQNWFGTHNIGIVTGRISDLIVVDFDDKESARAWFKNHRSAVKVIVETRRGVHFYFRCPDVEIRNSTGTPDIRGEGGYVCAPDSVVSGHRYQFVDGFSELSARTVYQPQWFRNAKAQSVREVIVNRKSARAYINKIFSIAGSRGHDSCFRACCKLRDAQLSESEALAEMIEWNHTNSDPPWTLKELTHKVKTAYEVKR